MLGFASYTWSDSLTDIARAKRRVQQAARGAQIVIVTFHGGAEGSDKTHVPQGTESFLGENRGDLRRFTHAVIDAGADLVVGSGPHVMRGMEMYKGRLIAYSMGNFAGYSVFSLGGVLSTSGVLQVTLNPDGSFRNGRLRPTQLIGEGTPAPGGDGIDLVRELSQDDFGSRAPRIDARGVIRARGRPGGGRGLLDPPGSQRSSTDVSGKGWFRGSFPEAVRSSDGGRSRFETEWRFQVSRGACLDSTTGDVPIETGRRSQLETRTGVSTTRAPVSGRTRSWRS